MRSTVCVKTKVLPGNKVEVQLPSGSEGQEVDVFVVVLPPSIHSPFVPHSLLATLQMLQNLEEHSPDVDETLLPLHEITLCPTIAPTTPIG